MIEFQIEHAEIALQEYRQCVSEKWDLKTILDKKMRNGLCYYFTYRFGFCRVEGDSMYELIDDACKEAGVEEEFVFGNKCGDYTRYSHRKRFAKRIEFLEVFVRELKKEVA